MKIAILADCWHPVINGVVTSMDVLRTALRAAGHEVELFVPGMPGHHDNDATVHRFLSLTVPIHKESRFVLPYPWRHIHRLRRMRPDVLHIHTPFNVGLIGLWMSRKLNLPYVFTHHTLWEEYVHYVPLVSHRWLREVAIALCRGICNGASAVIAPSEEVRDRLLQQGVTQPVEVIPTGIDVELFTQGDAESVRVRHGIAAEEPLAIYVGRMGKEKSLDFLLRTFCQVLTRVPQARLLMVGGGPEKAALQSLSESMGIQSRVLFTGYVARAELCHYFKASRVFVFASTTETQGLVSLEAQAAGCPVVAVRASGSSEAVADQESGFLVPAEGDAFATATVRLLTDASLRQRMSDKAVERAWQFSSQAMAAHHVEVYTRAIQAGRVSGKSRKKALPANLSGRI